MSKTLELLDYDEEKLKAHWEVVSAELKKTEAIMRALNIPFPIPPARRPTIELFGFGAAPGIIPSSEIAAANKSPEPSRQALTLSDAVRTACRAIRKDISKHHITAYINDRFSPHKFNLQSISGILAGMVNRGELQLLQKGVGGYQSTYALPADISGIDDDSPID